MPRKLTKAQQRFATQELACFGTPAEVAATIKEQYGIDVLPQLVEHYDPGRARGAELAKDLKDLFHETRAKYRADYESIPIANRVVRLERLERICRDALNEGKRGRGVALDSLERAAKETGGAYTNLRQLTGANGGAVQLEVGNLSRDELLGELRTLLTPPGGTAPAIVDRAAAPPKDPIAS